MPDKHSINQATSSGPRTGEITDHVGNNRGLKGEIKPRSQTGTSSLVQVQLLSEPSVNFSFLSCETGHLLHRSAMIKGIWLSLLKITME